MPLINGLKMACEPCIRGHRSTTCNHASERVMVPVRKPGRPLNDCPHPRGSNCGCRDLTVAIPRKRKCECAGEKSAAPKTSITQTTAEAVRPGSATPSVKETPMEGGSCCRPKESTAPSAVAPSSVAPATAPTPVSAPPLAAAAINGAVASQWNTNWNWNFGPLSPSHMGHPFQGFGNALPQHQLYQPAQPIRSVQPSQAPHVVQQGVAVTKKSDSDDEVEGRSSQEESGSSSNTDEPSARPSCCSTRSSSTAQFVPTPGTTSPESSSASSYASHSRSSSTSRTRPRSRRERQNTMSRTPVVPQPLPTTANVGPFPVMVQSPVSQAVHPISANPPACTNCGHNQPPILIYLPFVPPTQPIAYGGNGGSLYVVQPTPMPVPQQPEFPKFPPLTAITVPMGGCVSDTAGLGTIHECNCGPGCQCIGCIAHPFNDATQEYIRSAQNAYDDFGSPYQISQDMDPAAVPTTQSIANLSLSPEQILAPEDFFFVDYSSTQRGYPG